MFLHPTNSYEVFKIIRELKNTNSVGVDEFPTQLIKYVAEIISEPLAMIINLTFNEGQFPSLLKTSLVTPILK